MSNFSLKLGSTILIAMMFIALPACSNHGAEKDVRAEPSKTSTPVDETSESGELNAKYATLRKLDIATDKTPPRMMPELNEDLRRVRNYPEQPPTIPHTIESYQIDKKHNQCMDCHSRANVGVSQAPMVSISHFMDREGQFMASISARRYFCTQCHVAQLDVKPLVDNVFIDVDTIIEQLEQQNKEEGKKH